MDEEQYQINNLNPQVGQQPLARRPSPLEQAPQIPLPPPGSNSGQMTHPLEQAQQIEKEKARTDLYRAVGEANEIIAEATTVFPFTLIPDTITIDRAKISIAHRSFIKVAEVKTIRIEDVLDVTSNVGPFFGSLHISARFYNRHKPLVVNWLWREDAQRLKRILQGYLVAAKKQVDCNALSTKELATMLDQLGQGKLETS